MKKIILFICLFIAVFSSQAFATEISNGVLKVDIRDSGRFVARTDDGKRLMYSDINNGDYTSYTTIRIDDENYLFTGTPTFNNNVCVTDYYINEKNIDVQQIISLVYNTFTRKNDTMEIKYVVTNQGSESRKVNARIMIDTMIEDNDGAPFRIPGYGDVLNELELSGNSMPSYWQVFNKLDAPGLFAQGTLAANSNENEPSKIQFVNWPNIKYNYWNYTVNGSDIHDSAVAIYWEHSDPALDMLSSGQSREYVTYYGLGDFEADLKEPIALSITGQNEATANQSFTVTAYFQNVLNAPVDNVVATLQLPGEFSTSTPVSNNLGSFAAGQIKMCSWDVKIASTARTNEYTYSVQVSSNSDPNGVPKILSKKINVTGVMQDIPAVWNRTISSVHTEGIDENNLVIRPSGDVSYWTPWLNDFRISSSGVEQYLFQTTIDVPLDATGLTLSRDGAGDISVDDAVSVFVNGFKVSEVNIPGAGSIVIDKKYLMPGAKNDILLLLKDKQRRYIGLSKIKIQASLDPDYNASKVMDFNGFKIQYDENNPANCKILKYPKNLLFASDSGEGYQFTNADVESDNNGKVTYALLEADLNSSIYTYNGWHRKEKLFSSGSDTKIIFQLHNDYVDVQIQGAGFDIPGIDILKFSPDVTVDVTDTESLLVSADTDIEILNENSTLDFQIEIADNKIIPHAYGSIDLDEMIEVSASQNQSYIENSLCMEGGFTYDIFNDSITNYSIKASGNEDAKIRLNIPRFGELSFDSFEITEDEIITQGIGFTFSENCVIEGLRPSKGTSNYKVEITKLVLNRNCSDVKNLIKDCDLKITFLDDIELFGGITLKSGSALTAGVNNGIFQIGFDSYFILPDDDKTPLHVVFNIDGNGDIQFEGSVSLNKNLKIFGLDLSPDQNKLSGFSVKYEKAVYDDSGTRISPRKLNFAFDNVGIKFNITNVGEVNFYLNQFTITEDGQVENIKASIGGEVELFNKNLIISTKSGGTIELIKTGSEWALNASKVDVKFPNIGDNGGFAAVSDLKMTTNNGLESFSFKSSNEMTIFGEVISINGLGIAVNKVGSVYSLQLSADNTVCNIQKAIPQLKENPQISVKDLKLTVADLRNPSIEVDCGDITYQGNLNLDMGIKFSATGLTLNLKENSITLLTPSLTLPSIGGLKFYKDEACKNPVDNFTVSLDYLKVIYTSGKWDVSVGNVGLPGGCVYNLAEANVCKVTLAGLSMGKNDRGKFEFRIRRASATVASGYTTELKDVRISDNVSIGGGSITIPDLNIGGIGINDFKVTFGVEDIDGKNYPYFGGSCGVTIPGLGSIDGSLTVQRYSENFFKTIKEASFELTLAKAIPLGSSGLSLKMIRGSLTRGDLPKNFPDEFKFMFDTGESNLKFVSMGLGFVDTTSGGKVITAGADVWVEITNWGFALSANASVFEGFVQAEAGAAYANDIFAAYAKVRVLCIQGKVVFYIYKYDGKVALSGEGSVSVKLEAGKILNKKILRWRIKIPKNDVWFEGFSAKFGRFTNGKTGFQGSIGFPVLGKMSAFVGDGGLKFFTNYDIYIPKPAVTTASKEAPLMAYSGPMDYLFAEASTSTSLNQPVFEDIFESGVYKGSKVSFTNNASLDRIILYASTRNGIPSFKIKENGLEIPDSRLEYEVREVNEVDSSGNETGNVGIVELLAVKEPVNGGNYVIEAYNDEDVELTLVTKLNDPTLKINSVTENKTAKTLTASGEIANSNKDEIVNIILKAIDRNTTVDDPNETATSERIVATSDINSKIPGVKKFSIDENGKFDNVVIDTSIMKSGSYCLIAEMQRKVTCEVADDGSTFIDRNDDSSGISITVDEPATEEYEEYTREEYKTGDNLVIYDLENSDLQKVTNVRAEVSSYGTELLEKGDVFNTFITKLINRGVDAKLNYIWNKLPSSVQSDLSDESKEKFSIAAEAVNTYVIKDSNFYNSTVFKPTDPQITDAIRRLITKKNASTITLEENQKLNRLLLEAYFPDDFASSRKYSLDVGFDSIYKNADGYLLFAECFVDGQSKGTRKINLGSMTETRIGNLSEYVSVADDGTLTLKPIRMEVSIVPYKFIDPAKGFIYDYGTDLWAGDAGIEKVINNITLGPASDKVEVWIQKSGDYIIDDCSAVIPVGGYRIPVGGNAEAQIAIKTSVQGKIIAEVESVTCRNVTVAEKSVDVHNNVTVKDKILTLENASAVFENNSTDVTAGTNNFKFSIVPNVDALEALANTTGEIKIRISNADNPDDFKTVTIPYRFEIPKLSISQVYPETINSVTGGIIDIYGDNFLTDTRVFRDIKEDENLRKCIRVFLGTTELKTDDYESGMKRIAAIVPENFAPGQYDLKVQGAGPSNEITWTNKITIAAPEYDWVKIRDTGKVQRGTTGKFYFSLNPTAGYFGEAGLNVKNIPSGWSIQFNKNKVEMNEVAEVTVMVPAGEAVGDREIIIQGNDKTNSSFHDIGKLTVTVTDTPLDPAISSISSNKGRIGDKITIYGEGFGNMPIAQIVTKAGVPANMTITRADTNIIEAQIPAAAVSGNLRINNNGVFSNSLPFTVIPDNVYTNFDSEPVYIMLVPGESRTVNIDNDPNARYPMSTATADSILADADSSTGNVRISVPVSTLAGMYEVFVNVQYPNTIVQRKVTVYVVRDNATSDDLERQVIFSGRNLSIKISDDNIVSLQTVNIQLNGTTLTATPQRTSDGWVIDIGMVNDKSSVTYQVTYEGKGGTIYTSPVYEYIAEYENKYSDEDIYKVSLYENPNGEVKLIVTPTAIFNPAKMVANYKLDNSAAITANMTKTGGNWELSLGNLPEGTYVSGYFIYGTGTEDITSQKFLLQHVTNYTSDAQIPWNVTRGSAGNAILEIPSLNFDLEGRSVSPDSITVNVKFGSGETMEVPMVKTGTGYTVNIGCISSGTEVAPTFVFVVEGVKYEVTPDKVKFTDTGYEDSKNGLKAEYFNNQDFTDARLRITDPVVNFDWSTATPAGGLVENSTYSMRWSGKIQPEYSEEYDLYATVANGNVRVCVNGVEIMDGYGSQSGKVNLTAAQMTDIVVEYTSAGNGGIKLEWQSAGQAREIIPEDRLFAVDVPIPEDDDDDNDIPNGYLKVQYTNENSALTTNHLKPVLKVINTSTENIPFSDIKVKYWFTTEAKGIQTPSLYWVTREQQNAVLRVVKLDSETGEYYLEIGFKGTAAELRPGEFIEIKAAVNEIDWLNYNQANDYSFSTSYSGYKDWDKVTAYTADRLAWGVEPENTSPYQGKLDICSCNENRNPVSNMMNLSFAVVNRDSMPVKPSDIKIRYWFTNETGKAMNTSTWYCSLGNSMLNLKTVLNGNTANSYVEFTFTDAAPLIKEGEYFTLKAGINSSDWSNFSQTNDYSFDAVNTTCMENTKVTAYINGQLVWGVEP